MEEKTNTTPLSMKIQDKTEDTAASIKVREGNKSLREANSKVKLMLILFSVFVYVASFLLLHYLQYSGIGVVAVIPVIVVAWLCGCVPGVSVAAFAFFTNILMHEYLGQDWIDKVILEGAGIGGTIATMLIGGIVGRMSDLSMRVRKELFQRKQVEEELANHRHHLEKLVEERTVNLQKEISVRKNAEEENRKQNEYMNTLIESLSHPFYVIDANDYTIKIANSAARKRGMSEASTCHRLTHRQDKPCESVEHPCPLSETKKTKKAVVVEHIHYDKDGNPGIFEVHGYPIFDGEGNVKQMIEYSLDITERKETEEALKKSEAKYQNLIEHANNAIISTNKEGIIISFNIRAEEMFGYSRDEILGKSILLLSPPRDRGREERVLEMLKNTPRQ